MKQIIILILTLILCLALTACNQNNQEEQKPVTFYYQASTIDYSNPNGILASEIREAANHETDYAYLITQYLAGPQTAECTFPFPDGTKLESFDVLTGKINVILSNEISQLTGHKLTIACTCLSKTLLELTGLDAVTISANGKLLDGVPSITMTKDDFTLTDNNAYIPDESQS